MEGEHHHGQDDKYFTRIVEKFDSNQRVADWLQFICEADGVIFREIKVTKGYNNSN